MIINKETLLEKTQKLLEYNKIMEKVASNAISEEAANLLKESKPYFDQAQTQEIKNIVRTIFIHIKTSDNEPRSWFPSIGFLLPKITVQGMILDIDEALAIGLFIERGEELRKWVLKNENPKDGHEQDAGKTALNNLLSTPEDLSGCSPAAAEIFKIIDKEGKLRDIPVLRGIRRRIGSLEKELKNAISRYYGDEEYKHMLQSVLPSQRDGRTVLAVKANFRGRIRGIVHEVSSSGQTVFVEPLDVVEKNNEILLEKRNLDAEIQKIMRELTEKIALYADNIIWFHRTIIELECLRARAHYSIGTNGHFADNAEDILLRQARHPLIKKAVPIDIEMKNTTRSLIITGPNTGGKTVTLKTVGLFALMNQSGLALPLDEGSHLPLFDGIYADIGDEQSISQSLSTFSAHISTISAITASATEKSLVLLDELGSGTDPEEGSAIAMAILDFLLKKRSRMIVTTHHGVLKNYGYTKENVENASVEFDAQTLSPTYRIINGVPGESRALDIALSNGLDTGIINAARNYINGEKSDINALITGLEQKHRELAGIEKQSTIEQKKLKEEKRKADLKELQLRQKEAEIKREAHGKLQALLQESRKTLENLVRELKEGSLNREKTLKVKEFLNELARNVESESIILDEEELALIEEKQKSTSVIREFKEGMEVYAGPSKQRGTILRRDKRGRSSWIVETGSLKVSFNEKDIIPAAPVPNGRQKSATWAAELETAPGPVLELRLLGMRLNEATDSIRRQIDAASIAGIKTFSVIHGKGSGILQKGIHDFLKNEPAVADYYFSRPEQGGFGRTEVVLY
ncbi:MAG: endonuclease MutS2 [Treponema sp.]|jgi:DNA mismatch repair protein MutS2|nr:endonuclease MutS2 [Treponema sp.]